MNATITFAEMTNNELRQFIEKKGLPKPKSAVRTKAQLIAHINTHWIAENAVVDEEEVCEYCGASDKSVGLATGDNGLEMWVCRFCDVDGSNYNGWGDGEPEWGNVVATMFARTKFAVYEEEEEVGLSKCPCCENTYTEAQIQSEEVVPCNRCYKCFVGDCGNTNCDCYDDDEEGSTTNESEEADSEFEDCNVCGYAHHYEDKCPNETTCEHYEKSEKAEAEEEEEDKCSECGLDEDDCECDVCYGKHCDKKSCLKLATGWNRSRELDGQRFALNLYCDECIEQDCFDKCEACRVEYPLTSLGYRTGGLFGEHCGNNLYCEACCKDIEEKMTLREEPAPVATTTYTIYASEDGNDYNAEIYCYGDLKQALNAFNGEKKRKASKKYLYKKLKLQDDKTEKEIKNWQRTKEEIVRPTLKLAELNTFNFDYTLFKHERGGFCKYAVYNNTANHYVACDFDGDKIIGWGQGTIYKTLNAWTTANWKEQRIKDGNNKTTRNNAYRETKYIPLQIIDDDELIYGPLYEEIEWESSMTIEKK